MPGSLSRQAAGFSRVTMSFMKSLLKMGDVLCGAQRRRCGRSLCMKHPLIGADDEKTRTEPRIARDVARVRDEDADGFPRGGAGVAYVLHCVVDDRMIHVVDAVRNGEVGAADE